MARHRITLRNAQQLVLAKYPDLVAERHQATCTSRTTWWVHARGERSHVSLGEGRSRSEAWRDAAERLLVDSSTT